MSTSQMSMKFPNHKPGPADGSSSLTSDQRRRGVTRSGSEETWTLSSRLAVAIPSSSRSRACMASASFSDRSVTDLGGVVWMGRVVVN